ncbi:MAG: hypothetical protein J3Q66DRAFT_439182 [Benniella sp.]|nr:MAG: hypothetical protein J3Q66DRAFT_439182 [Benniella sp.]
MGFASKFKNKGVREPLTTRIKGILDEYPDGTQIARELLQNSDDARSKIQWYLLDHRHHIRQHQSDTDQVVELKIFDPALAEYMGPALLAGSDSVFEERDFTSMKNLADSEKKEDETKIGQMGIGFNSVYHLTDCPSFITGNQFMMIEPHERIFNGVKTECVEGIAHGDFVEDEAGLQEFPDLLKTFAVLEDIDFSKPYPGTIFRFPLRTEEQAKAEYSKISKKAYPAEKVMEMLEKLKDEALKGILFLKHIERVEIYEIKEGENRPNLLFKIEIVNAEEVRQKRQGLLANLSDHVRPDSSASRDAILDYSIRSIFRLTQEDGTSTEETWHIATLVNNVVTAREYMQTQTDEDIGNHKLIPWVGVAAPTEPGKKIENSSLFCFLPIGIPLPFHAHVNGHFAVKQSRREIWTDQGNDLSNDSSAKLKSAWNVHLFKKHVPEVYAMFLDTLGLVRGKSYDLWPLSDRTGVGLDRMWKDLLEDTLHVVCRKNLRVFFCKTNETSDLRAVNYKESWIAGRDLDKYPLILQALQALEDVVIDLPDPILKLIPEVAKTLMLENRILTPELVRKLLRKHKIEWSDVVSPETKIEMLKYCIQDEKVADLEGLPLLPLAGNQWVEFSVSESPTRFLVPRPVFKVLSYANDGLVDIDIDNMLVDKFNEDASFHVYWSTMEASIIASRVRDVFQNLCYQSTGNEPQSLDSIQQRPDTFPSNEWIDHFWDMIRFLLSSERRTLLSQMEGIHVIPITRDRLAPLSTKFQVAYLDTMKESTEPTLKEFINVLEDQLEYRVLRRESFITENIAEDYVFEISNAVKVLNVIDHLKKGKLYGLNQALRQILCNYMAKRLQIDQRLDDVCLRTLKSLPIYIEYENSTLVPLQRPESKESESKWRVASGFSRDDNPWSPVSVHLLEDGQPMHQHLIKTINTPTINETEYWYLIISKLDQYPEDEWDPMMETFCNTYHTHFKDSRFSFKSVMQGLEFVRTQGPRQSGQNGDQRRLSPRSVINATLARYYMGHENVFPSGAYSRSPVFGMLSEMGMRSVTDDAAFVLDRVQALSSLTRSNREHSDDDDEYLKERTDALNALYASMNADFSPTFSSQEMKAVLRSQSWILAKSLSDEKTRLYSAQECRPKSDVILVGSQMPLAELDFNNKDLIHCMGWDQPPPLNAVLANFVSVIERFKEELTLDKERRIQDKDAFTFFKIYCYLFEMISDSSRLSTMKEALADKPWILINGTLHTTDRVALELTCDLAPHYVQAATSDPQVSQLFLAMGVRQRVGQADLEGLLSKVKARLGGNEKLSKDDLHFVVRILDALTLSSTDFQWSKNLLVPTKDMLLCEIKDVVYDDVGAQTDKTGVWEMESTLYTFASGEVSKSLAEKLGVAMLSDRCAEEQRDSTFEPWAQEEDILDRIMGILNDYDPSSIFAEFLQNASDAGATKCCFMFDTSNDHPRTKLLSPEMATWQGPALVIYNDAEFTDSDFKALSKLGVGNKRDDPSKIGRHGLGFNSAYHFTDVPSVVSGEHIVFFDPQRKYLPKQHGEAAQGGHRYNFVKMKKDVRSGQFEPYKGFFGCDMETPFKGTIFRLPLRIHTLDTKSTDVKVIDRFWTLETIQSMFRSWEAHAKIALLFLDKLNVVELDDNVAFKWSATKEVQQLGDTMNEQQQQRGSAASTGIVNIRTSTSTGSMKWFVHTERDFPHDIPENIRNLATDNRWDTDRGIAFPFDYNFKAGPFSGRIFTHLPTPILTGLPFHIHGVFALITDRKRFAGGETDPQWNWNQYVMEAALPRTAANAFEKLFQYMFRPEAQGGPRYQEAGQVIDHYFKFWPFKLKTEGFEGENGVSVFTKNLIRESHWRPIYACRSAHQTPPVVGHKGQDIVFPGILDESLGKFGQTIRGRLRSIGIDVCDCPNVMQVQIETHWKSSPGLDALTYRRVNSDMIRLLIRRDTTFLPSLKNDDEKRWIFGVILGELLDPKALAAMKESMTGLPIIPLMNGEWKALETVNRSPQIYYTAKPEMRELIEGGGLVNETLFKTVKDQRQGEKPAPNLEDILHRLVHNTDYCIQEMSPGELAARIRAENLQGIPIGQREKIWRHLDCYSDLSPFYDVPILKTLDGRFESLRSAHQGLEISSVQDSGFRMNVRDIATLLMDLGLVVFDATQNHSHPFLTSKVPRAEKSFVLKTIAGYCNSWPDSRVITENEATILRDMISSSGAEIQPFVANLGSLKIWRSWAPSNNGCSPLICARGSYFLDCHYTFDWTTFGDNSVIIRHPSNNHLSAMGARSLTLVDVLEDRILPKFQDGTQAFTSTVRTEYIEIFKEIINLAMRTGPQSNSRAQNLLKNGRFILARDNILKNSATLFDANDPLCAAIFGEVSSMFPYPSVWDQIWPNNRQHLFSFRDSKNSIVIQECANRVLEMTQGQTQLSPEMVRSRAVVMVDFIFRNNDQINWLDPKWKIVPAETTTTSPYNDCAPDLPRYQSFVDVMDPIWHDIVWTQCAFFPDTLKPPQPFKNRFSTVGRPNPSIVVDHLKVLVTDLAPKWKSVDQQMALKSAIYSVYKFLDETAASDSSRVEQLLKNRLQKPYLLNEDDADLSDPESWLRPDQLMLDIDDNIGKFHTVSHKMQKYRRFLAAVGVLEMKEVVGMVDVPNGRKAGEVEIKFRNAFEAQDQHKGLMDVRYKFANGHQIMAHRDWLAFTNEYFYRRFTSMWAEYLTRDLLDPSMAIIDLSTQDVTYEAFYGLLYYLYADRLIDTNGPPPPSATSTTHVIELGDRVQYLMDLLRLSHEYDIIRLKKLIAHEIVVQKKVTHGNVFDVRGYAMQTESTDIQEHCEAYIEKNGSSIPTYLNGEIEEQRKLLDQLTGDDDGARRAEIKSLISELENNLLVLDTLARKQ